jgi:non-specific serine/threonine protein kinase/serine/threonine-protein kinase
MADRDPDLTRGPSGDSTEAPTPDSEQTTRASLTPSSETDRIGNYRILEQVGAGGMGEVYRAEQSEPIRRTVALKIIKRGMDTKEVITRFEAERQALALMDHPSIARVFDAGSTPRGRPYFAMEYVKGIPITTYCDEHKLSMRARLELFIQLCEGVQHAHQKAIIHRDLKPSNVLVTIQDDKPVPKIIDFGVAKATAQKLTEKTMYTALGEMIGTPEYMSPEQAALTGEDIDTRTDVYALGVILYELLAGALPFEPTELRKAGFEGIIRMIREQDPVRPSSRVGTLGAREAVVAHARRTLPGRLTSRLRGDLDWITMRALEKDRTRRYGSPAELAADVRRHLRHEPVLAGPPSAAYRTRKFVRRHTLGVGVATAGVLVLVGFAATMTVQANRIAHERDRADQEAETSDRVSEFLVSVFNVSDPGEARGNTIRAREVLDNGALRIQREEGPAPPTCQDDGLDGARVPELGAVPECREPARWSARASTDRARDRSLGEYRESQSRGGSVSLDAKTGRGQSSTRASTVAARATLGSRSCRRGVEPLLSRSQPCLESGAAASPTLPRACASHL